MERAASTILVVDDERGIQNICRRFLEAEGYDVLLASSGEEGLDVFDENARDISLVLLDLTMPGVGGGEVLAELRNADPDLPVIILSGYTHEIAARRTGNPVSTEFLQKPYEPEDLTAGVRRLLASTSA